MSKEVSTKERIASLLHQEWSKTVQELLRRCTVSQPDSLGNMSYSVPLDLKIRLSVESTTPFEHLPDHERDKALKVAAKVMSLVSNGREVAYSLPTDCAPPKVTVAPTTVRWASITCDGYDSDMTVRTEESPFYIPGGMSDDEKLALAEALREVEEKMRPILELRSQSSRFIRGRGTVKTVRCSKQILSGLPRIRNSSIVIDNNNWVVSAVECFMPVKEGDTICLIVREPRDDERLIKCDLHGWSKGSLDNGRIECSVCIGNDDTYLQIDEMEGSDE